LKSTVTEILKITRGLQHILAGRVGIHEVGGRYIKIILSDIGIH
jgi:hypothetical protein